LKVSCSSRDNREIRISLVHCSQRTRATRFPSIRLDVGLLHDRGGLLVVASIGSPTYDVAACGDDARNFYIWSGLGCTPMVGLGLALAQPRRRIAVFTGDGDVLMDAGFETQNRRADCTSFVLHPPQQSLR